jgi:hypothetical protein
MISSSTEGTMLKQALILTFIAVGAGPAQAQPVQEPAIEHEARFAMPEPSADAGASAASLMSWISDNFDLAAPGGAARIERASSARLAAVAYNGFQQRRHVLGVYEDATRTVFLPEQWTGSSPEEQSVLVHQLVHHLQNLAGNTFQCAEEREKLAYAAQERWLGLFGRNLADAFGIDATTLLLSTECVP